MEPEGMVHALQQIHRLLIPDGHLVDIHPVPDTLTAEVHQRGKIILAEHVPSTNAEAVQQAEEAITEVVNRRLFTIVQETTFDFRTYGDSVPELRDHIVETSAFDEDSTLAQRWENEYAQTASRMQQALHAAGPQARAAIQEQARITHLHALAT